MPLPARHTGSAIPLHGYRYEFLVLCPKCGKEAVVSVDNGYMLRNGKLQCGNCHFSQTAKDLIRYNAVLRRSCDHCGKRIEKTVPNNKQKVKTLRITCPHCGTTRTYQPRNEAYQLQYQQKEVGDPVFNLPLRFQGAVRGQVFWAYNRKHLSEIQQYVAADLRERPSINYTSMVERLPAFILDRKNRAAILQLIQNLLAVKS